MGHKGGPGKSMKNALYVQKAPLGLKQHEKIKPISLAIVKLRVYEGKESVSQAVS